MASSNLGDRSDTEAPYWQDCVSLNTHKYPTVMQGYLCSTEIQKLDFPL